MSDHDNGEYHVHAHVTDTKVYAGILAGLLFLTALTVGLYNVRLGAANLVVAIVIATVKASLVVTYFMHMKYEAKFNVLLFLGSLAFGGVFLAYTINDTNHRGNVDAWHGSHVDRDTGFVAQGGLGAGSRLSSFRLSEDGCSEGTWPADSTPPWPCSWFAFQERYGSDSHGASGETAGAADAEAGETEATVANDETAEEPSGAEAGAAETAADETAADEAVVPGGDGDVVEDAPNSGETADGEEATTTESGADTAPAAVAPAAEGAAAP